MIEINLLPRYERKGKEAKRFQRSVILLSFVLLGVALAFLKWNAVKKEGELDARIRDLEAEISNLNKALSGVGDVKKERENLQKRLEVIQRLEKDRLLAAVVMDDLSGRVPEKVWLERLEKQGDKVVSVGVALDEETIADFMTSLKASPYIEVVELESVTKHAAGGVDLKRFSITFKLKQ